MQNKFTHLVLHQNLQQAASWCFYIFIFIYSDDLLRIISSLQGRAGEKQTQTEHEGSRFIRTEYNLATPSISKANESLRHLSTVSDYFLSNKHSR